ncbi:hypothetical protein JCM8208_001301 [Rhodotorula glutinis]
MSSRHVADPSASTATLYAQDWAANTLVRGLAQFHQPLQVARTGSAAVGELALGRHGGPAARNLATNVVINLFFYPGRDGLDLEQASARLVAYLHEQSILFGESSDGHPIMQHRNKLFTVVLEKLPAWFRRNEHNLELYDGPYHDGQPSTAPVILFFALVDVAVSLRSGDLRRINTTLSVLDVFSQLSSHALLDIEGNRTPRYDWSRSQWVRRFKNRIEKLPNNDLDAARYREVVRMLLAGSLSPAVLDNWSTWLVEQPGYWRAKNVDSPSEDEQVRARHAERNALQAFVEKVIRLILGDSIGVAHSLGKAIPAGIAVFHPDSTRRRRYDEQHERALDAL